MKKDLKSIKNIFNYYSKKKFYKVFLKKTISYYLARADMAQYSLDNLSFYASVSLPSLRPFLDILGSHINIYLEKTLFYNFISIWNYSSICSRTNKSNTSNGKF